MFDEIFTRIIRAPEFLPNFDWLNTKQPLTLEKLKGHIVVLDFWTYCCINCMHMLPVLCELEKKYKGKPVVFIGVHSAKFFNEEDTKNIEQAVARYEISHPVLVDKKMTMWQRYGVSGWPTIVIIDPSGKIVYKQSGEGQKNAIEDTIDVILEESKKSDKLAKEPIKIERTKIQNKNTLSFPGKISICEDGKIAISDSNHNRIIITDLFGKIEFVIGSGQMGFSDGDFSYSSFFRPQGVVWKENSVFVADTENHAIRKIDLRNKKVTTLVGNGRQGPWISTGGKGRDFSLTSPWDLAARGSEIFIAMAGNHQIWSYDIETEFVKPLAGNGVENIVDGPNSLAQLAQPSGISIYNDRLFFADSEVSAIREIDLIKKQVKTIVGRGLFVFGHQDGNTDSALFQHPLGLSALNDRVFVADTYNSAIREIDLKKREVLTIIGNSKSNSVCNLKDSRCDVLGLYEPNDVEFFDEKLYITDTNNHLIRIYNIKEKILQTLKITQ